MLQDCITLHRLFRRLQQKNRFVGPVEHSGLTPLETHFLIELQANPTQSISELSALLAIDQSTGSRIAASFKKKGFIKASSVKDDKRKQALSLTAKAEKKIQSIDSYADSLIDTFKRGLSASEFNKLSNLIELIGDGYGAAPGAQRASETAFRTQQRRVTRCFGLLGDSVFESGFTSSEWQTLAEVSLSPVSPQPTELANLLGLKQNSLSTVVDSLEKQKLLKRAKATHDKRATVLIATSDGLAETKRIEHSAAKAIRQGLENQKTGSLKKYIDIVRRFVGEYDGVLPPLLPDFQISRNQSEQARQQARVFAAETFVKSRRCSPLPENFFPSSQTSFTVLRDDKVVAALQLSVSKKAAIRVDFSCWDSAVTPWSLTGILNGIFFEMNTSCSPALKKHITCKALSSYLSL